MRTAVKRFTCLALCNVLLAGSVFARPSKIALIDDQCSSIRSEFAEATPAFFTGPDPWLKIEHALDACPPDRQESGTDEPSCLSDGLVAATVYQEGASIKWVILQMQGPGDHWFETTDYFFDDKGDILKSERSLEQYASHIRVQEDEYFINRKLSKTNYRHSALPDRAAPTALKENWDLFFDPKSPFYVTTDDLPALFRQVDHRYLAGMLDGCFLAPAKKSQCEIASNL